MTATGDDALFVAEHLRGWLARRFGGTVETAETATSITGGLDSWIHRVRFSGSALPPPWREPLIARVKRGAGDLPIARHEAAVQAWCADAGYPCPRILVVLAPGELLDVPVQVMELVPGSMVLDRLTAAPWQAPRLLRRLARLQARLHQLDPTGFPSEGVTSDLADHRLRLVRSTVEQTRDEDLRRGLDRAEALLPRLREVPPVVCHGDFHPLNVLVDGDDSWVLDWTDAGLGDPHGDVSRTALLFRMASIVADGRADRLVLKTAAPWMARHYLRTYEAHARLDRSRLALWDPLHLLHGWSQVVGLHSGQFSGDAPDDRASTVPAGLSKQLQRWFDVAMRAVE